MLLEGCGEAPGPWRTFPGWLSEMHLWSGGKLDYIRGHWVDHVSNWCVILLHPGRSTGNESRAWLRALGASDCARLVVCGAVSVVWS